MGKQIEILSSEAVSNVEWDFLGLDSLSLLLELAVEEKEESDDKNKCYERLLLQMEVM